MGMYFGPDVDVRIVEYINETDQAERHRIFDLYIRPAFEKLIDGQMNAYKFYTIDDASMLKNDCLSMLYELLPKFDPSRGKKGFSYFNVVTKHWFIWKYRERQKRQRNEADNFYGIDHEVVKSDPSIVDRSYEDQVMEKEFWAQLFLNIDKWKKLLKKPQEVQILEAISFLLQNPDIVPISNRKAVYLYIREMTDMTTKQVIAHLKRIRELYFQFREEFESGVYDGGTEE